MAGAAFGEVQVSLFVALFVAGAALGEVQASLFVAGAALGEVQVSLFSWQAQRLAKFKCGRCSTR